MIESVINNLIGCVSLEYMWSFMIGSYLILKLADLLVKDKIPKWLKRSVTAIVGSVLFIVFKEFSDVSFEKLICTYFVGIFLYDVAIKTLLDKIQINYKH